MVDIVQHEGRRLIDRRRPAPVVGSAAPPHGSIKSKNPGSWSLMGALPAMLAGIVADWAIGGRQSLRLGALTHSLGTACGGKSTKADPRLTAARSAPQHRPCRAPLNPSKSPPTSCCGLFDRPISDGREPDSATLFWVIQKSAAYFRSTASFSPGASSDAALGRFEIRADENFDAVVIACASRENTWINAEIRRLYRELFDEGRAHSIEAFEDGALVEGFMACPLGAAFFGRACSPGRDASKVALVHLVARLRLGGFRLLDTQFVTRHLASLGAIEVARESYLQMLGQALSVEADFNAGQPLARCVGQRR